MFRFRNQFQFFFVVTLWLFQCTSKTPRVTDLYEVDEAIQDSMDADTYLTEFTETTNDLSEVEEREGLAYDADISVDSMEYAQIEDISPDTDISVDLPSVIGGDRPATVILPSNYTSKQAWPLLILLHGYGVNGTLQDLYLGVSARVDRLGFIEVIPEGTQNVYGLQFWNAAPSGSGFAEVDDVAYLRALIEEAKNTYHIDDTKIILLGHSNGAFMAYRMACEASDIVTAVGTLAGSIFGGLETCLPSKKVSVLHMHGTSDTVVPYQGGELLGIPYPSVEELIAFWRSVDECSDDISPTESFDADEAVLSEETTVMSWTHCSSGSFVELWKMEGSPHIPAFTEQAKDRMLERLIGIRKDQ